MDFDKKINKRVHDWYHYQCDMASGDEMDKTSKLLFENDAEATDFVQKLLALSWISHRIKDKENEKVFMFSVLAFGTMKFCNSKYPIV